MSLQDSNAGFYPAQANRSSIPEVSTNGLLPVGPERALPSFLDGNFWGVASHENAHGPQKRETNDSSVKQKYQISSPTTSTIKQAPSKSKRASRQNVTRKRRKSSRALTGFNLYFRECREEVAQMRRQLPGGKNRPSIAKIISLQWKELSPHERVRYDTRAAEEKLRQYNEKQGWISYANDQTNSNDVDFSSNEPIGMQEPVDDDEPWPIESIQEISRQLDRASIDFLIRALLK